MPTDRLTKLLLALIAIALWLNVFFMVSGPGGVPAVEAAQEAQPGMERIEVLLENMDANLEVIALGSCMNARLC